MLGQAHGVGLLVAVIELVAQMRPTNQVAYDAPRTPWQARVVLTELNGEEWSWEPFTAEGFGTQRHVAWFEWVTRPKESR